MKSFFSGQNDALNSHRENKRFLCFYEDVLDSPQPSVPFVIQDGRTIASEACASFAREARRHCDAFQTPCRASSGIVGVSKRFHYLMQRHSLDSRTPSQPVRIAKWCIFHKRLEFARWPSLGAELVLCLGPASVFALLWNGSFWFGWACDADGLWFKLDTKRGLSWPRGSALTVEICRREMLVVVETKLRFISNLGVNHTRKAATTWKILSF